MGSSVSVLHDKKQTNQTKQHTQLARSSNQLVRNVNRQQNLRRLGAPSKPNVPSKLNDPSLPIKPSEPSEPSGVLHLALERRVAPIQGHDGGNIIVLHKVGILAKLVFLDGENQVQVDKLRAALGVLHSKDTQVYVVHDYNARGIPGTRRVQLCFASPSVFKASIDV